MFPDVDEFDQLREVSESIAPGRWPTADVTALRDCARRCRELADACNAVADDIVGAHRGINGVGHLQSAIGESAALIAGTPDSTTSRARAEMLTLADAVDRYADAASSAQHEMAVIASIADRDRLRGELMSGLGDGSAQVQAASGGRMALTAGGDEYIDQAGNIDTRDHHDDGQPPTAATSGMMPFAALGGLAAAGAGLGAAFHHTPDASGGSALSDADTDWLQRRAAQLQASLGPSVAGSVRMAVGIGIANDGSRTVVVGTGETFPYLRREIPMNDAEVIAANGRPAELAIVDHMTSSGLRAEAVAAATPMDSSVVHALEALDAEMFAPTADDAGLHHWVSADGWADQP